MLKRIVIISFFFFFVSHVFGQNWERFKDTELGFIADFPASPNQSVQKIPADSLNVLMHSTQLVLTNRNIETSNFVYGIYRTDYPEGMIEDSDEFQNERLDDAADGAVNNMNGTLEYVNKIKLNGYLGRSLKIKAEGLYMYMNLYLVDDFLYLSQVLCSETNDMWGRRCMRHFSNRPDPA